MELILVYVLSPVAQATAGSMVTTITAVSSSASMRRLSLFIVILL